jgi:5-methylcytosine-specific restriction endonuclease McrA
MAAVLYGICKYCGVSFQWNQPSKKRMFCSRKCAAKFNIRPGSEHPRWKGGDRRRTWAVVKATAERVKEVGKCERCGSIKHLQGHHKKHYALHPELRSDPSNIEVLCADCHSLEHPKARNALLRPRKRSGITIICPVCNELRYMRLSHKIKFCSRKCYLVWRVPAWSYLHCS